MFLRLFFEQFGVPFVKVEQFVLTFLNFFLHKRVQRLIFIIRFWNLLVLLYELI